jgi:hypothetical protein
MKTQYLHIEGANHVSVGPLTIAEALPLWDILKAQKPEAHIYLATWPAANNVDA